MRHRKKQDPTEDFFATGSLPTHIFRAGDVARILGIENEKWRLQKFLSGKHYQLSSSRQIGKGQGSWRLFKREDILRIGIAHFLARDGFSPKFISKALREIEEPELTATAADFGFFRGKQGPEMRVIVGDASVRGENGPYYVLRLGDLIQEIDSRIEQEAKAGR